MKLNRFLKADFDCDNCQENFSKKAVYSFAPNLDRLSSEKYPTYCLNCAVIVEKEENQPQKLDKRALNKTGRVHLFATRAKKEWVKKLKTIARKEKLKYIEVLEKALECYERHQN